jgi:nucleotide-binding universal stress UspA family protein
MKKILVGIDGSQASLNAARYAVRMAKRIEGHVMAINVINEQSQSISEYYKDISHKLQREAEGVLRRAVSLIAAEGVTITTEVDFGSPDAVLAERARADQNVAMIVTAASKRSRIANLFVRSKSHALVDQVAAGLQCPVVVVPASEEDFLKRV